MSKHENTQERLINISILNIEKARTNELNVDHAITNFANQKAKKTNSLKLIKLIKIL